MRRTRSGCSALATIGQAANPTMIPIKSRRLMVAPEAPKDRIVAAQMEFVKRRSANVRFGSKADIAKVASPPGAVVTPPHSTRMLLSPLLRRCEASPPDAALRSFGLVLLGLICLDPAGGQ